MARSVWTGSIGFGLVNVPVKAFTAVRDHDVHFHQLDAKSGSRIRYKKVAEKSGREVDQDEIEMGFEVGRGRYVTFDSKELDAIRPASTRTIEVTDFVALDDVDPIYYERTYWLAPATDAAKRPYQLLLAAMEERERVAIGTVTMRNKPSLVAVRPLDGVLAMSTMHFADEIVARRDIDEIPSRRSRPGAKELRMATQLVDALTAEWRPEQYKDTYADELRDQIERKERGDDVVETETPDDGPSGKVIDLAEALERSLGEAGAKRRKPAPKRRAAGGGS